MYGEGVCDTGCDVYGEGECDMYVNFIDYTYLLLQLLIL